MNIICKNCGKSVEKSDAEINRQIKKGRIDFFCSISCAAKFNNLNKKAKVITKICPICKQSFQTKQDRHEATFCSRSCASRGSLTAYRIEKARMSGKINSKNLSTEERAKGLRKREDTKYQDLKEYLKKLNTSYIFEYALQGYDYIYDLALLDYKIIFEFDDKSHNDKRVKEIDQIKDQIAKDNGWIMYRIKTNSKVISHLLIKEILENDFIIQEA